ncbi:MAG TPA: biopolymer transporter ExbD [Schlesneria sp.]
MTHTGSLTSQLGDEPLISRKSLHNDAHFDITAMIDLVFMMNIFFLVTTITAALADIDLPTARNCIPADRESSVVITVLAAGEGKAAGVYIGDDTTGPPITEPEVQRREVLRAIEEGVRKRFDSVIIRAERDVPLRNLMHVARAVATVEGMQLKVSVAEKE